MVRMREVHPCELMTCRCASIARPLIWVTDELRPRCNRCLCPVRRQVSQLSMHERWLLLVLGLLDGEPDTDEDVRQELKRIRSSKVDAAEWSC